MLTFEGVPPYFVETVENASCHIIASIDDLTHERTSEGIRLIKLSTLPMGQSWPQTMPPPAVQQMSPPQPPLQYLDFVAHGRVYTVRARRSLCRPAKETARAPSTRFAGLAARASPSSRTI